MDNTKVYRVGLCYSPPHECINTMAKKTETTKVTDLLASHHAYLLSVFSLMENALKKASTLEDVDVIAQMVLDLVQCHGEAEETFLFQPLDALLAHQGRRTSFATQHREHTSLLIRAQTARSLEAGRRDLLMAFRILRAHFKEEEKLVIPAAEAAFQPASLESLGKAWLDSHSLGLRSASSR